VLRLFDFDFFFFGTATVGLQRYQDVVVSCGSHATAAPGYRRIALVTRAGVGTGCVMGQSSRWRSSSTAQRSSRTDVSQSQAP
jgi:hypothetical protein